MTKTQSNQAFNTATGENKTAGSNAQSSYDLAQGDVGSYQGQLAQYSAANPFGAGGAYQTAQNQGLASTAAAGTEAAQQAAQSAAVRSGENPAAAIAAGTNADIQNTRAQMADVAEANQNRIGQGATYGKSVLQASEVPEQMEASLTGQQLGAQSSTLGDETSASKTPSFWQELGQGVINAGTAAAGAAAKSCWIAARLYGGWQAREVALIRLWLTHKFSKTRTGRPLVWAYSRWGQKIADDWMPKSVKLSILLGLVFYHAHQAALAWTESGEGAEILIEYDRLRRIHGWAYAGAQPPKLWLDYAVKKAGEVHDGR